MSQRIYARAEAHANWRGGRYAIKQGYIRVRTDYGSDMEHRVVAARALGRRLKSNETVHHVNGDKHDNDPRNLLICSNAYHRELERRMATAYQRLMFPTFSLSV